MHAGLGCCWSRSAAESQAVWHPLHAQLPALERLDLVLNLAGGAPPLETAAALGRLSTLASLSSLSLRAGPMHGLLRHLRLPTSVKAGFPSNTFRYTAAAAPACKYVHESCK